MILRQKPLVTDTLPSRIRLTDTPPGEPQKSQSHIRCAWVGVEVPTIGTTAPTVLGKGALMGSMDNSGGYLVPIRPAIAMLTLAGHNEVAWWITQWVAEVKKAKHDIPLGDYLVFSRGICREVR